VKHCNDGADCENNVLIAKLRTALQDLIQDSAEYYVRTRHNTTAWDNARKVLKEVQVPDLTPEEVATLKAKWDAQYK
jgi:isopentenyl diphosphate isomerase/L-lactate dehydrogenase-like FMN-dependent dehydrogenase